MHSLPPLLVDLAMVLGVAALTSLLCQKLHLPVVMGYLLAGLVVGPHIPIPLAADAENVKVLAELGVIFLLFSIGLEFNREKLMRSGPTAVDRLKRRVLRLGLRLGVGLPLLAVAQPFLPRLSLVAVLGVLTVVALGLLHRDLGEVRESMAVRYPWMRAPEEREKP